jgi:hypothetical protein
MLKKISKNKTRLNNNHNNHNRRAKRAVKNVSRKMTKKNLQKQVSLSGGGCVSCGSDNLALDEGKKEKFQVTTLRNINQSDLDRFKISNYVNNNIDWGIMPGPPPTDCVIM